MLLLHQIKKIMGTVLSKGCRRQAHDRPLSNLPTEHVETPANCKPSRQGKD